MLKVVDGLRNAGSPYFGDVNPVFEFKRGCFFGIWYIIVWRLASVGTWTAVFPMVTLLISLVHFIKAT